MESTISFGKRFLCFAIHLLAICDSSRAQFDPVIQNLEEHNRKTLNEMVFLHVDREIYYPGDTLWFKAYVRNEASLYHTSFSRDLFVYLFDENGDVIQDSKFLIKDSGVKGQIILDRELQKGNYYLVAYSSWMENFQIDRVFKKKIHVKYLSKDYYEVVPQYDQQAYFPGDTVYMQIKCYDQFLREEKKVSFDYKVSTGGEKIVRGSVNRLNGFDNQIRFILPEEISKPYSLEVWGDHKLVDLEQEYTLPVHYDIQVDFYPEGGSALNGEMNNMAFKASYPRGGAAKTEGEVVSENGEVITSVATRHAGMGSFLFVPRKGTDYYLQITKPSGIDRRFKLPKGEDRGWLLTARSNQDKINVQVRNQGLSRDTCLLTLMIRGYLFYSQVVSLNQGQNLSIPTDTLPSGVGVITLFDQELLPRAERLVFVNYHKRQQVDMSTKSDYSSPREMVTLQIKLSNDGHKPVSGDYSLAVVDEKLGLSDKIKDSHVYSATYFSPEIKGRVLHPAYYFQTGSRAERYHLDLLMLTQGWRNYRYMENIKSPGSLAGPVSRDVISGTILKKRSILNPEPDKGRIKVYFGGITHTIRTDSMGNFSFLPVFDRSINPNIFLSAVDENGKDNVIIRLDSSRFKQKLMDYVPALIDSLDRHYYATVQTYQSIEKLYEWIRLNHFLIEPVTVTAEGPGEKASVRERRMYTMPDKHKKIATQSDIEENENVYKILIDMAEDQDLSIRYNIEKDVMEYYYWVTGGWIPVTWYVDGFPWRDEPRAIYPGAIKDMKLLIGNTPKFLFDNQDFSEFGDATAGGTAVVAYIITDTTKYASSVQAYRNANRMELPPYAITKEFYKPVYDTEEKKNAPHTDFRRTIHWEPEIKLDSTGRASISFYNADQFTNIRCILQGISDEGFPAYRETSYQVRFTGR